MQLKHPAACSRSILWLGLGSVRGQEAGSLLGRASALQNSSAASDACAVCSVAPLAPVAPTLRAPRVLAGGGPVGTTALLIWEGINKAKQESHSQGLYGAFLPIQLD